MISDELDKIIEYMHKNDVFSPLLFNDFGQQVSTNSIVSYNKYSGRLTIEIVNSNVVYSFYVYKNRFIYAEYGDIDLIKRTCKSRKISSFNEKIDSEEYFFQFSTIKSVQNITYKEYKKIEEIIKLSENNIIETNWNPE